MKTCCSFLVFVSGVNVLSKRQVACNVRFCTRRIRLASGLRICPFDPDADATHLTTHQTGLITMVHEIAQKFSLPARCKSKRYPQGRVLESGAEAVGDVDAAAPRIGGLRAAHQPAGRVMQMRTWRVTCWSH